MIRPERLLSALQRPLEHRFRLLQPTLIRVENAQVVDRVQSRCVIPPERPGWCWLSRPLRLDAQDAIVGPGPGAASNQRHHRQRRRPTTPPSRRGKPPRKRCQHPIAQHAPVRPVAPPERIARAATGAANPDPSFRRDRPLQGRARRPPRPRARPPRRDRRHPNSRLCDTKLSTVSAGLAWSIQYRAEYHASGICALTLSIGSSVIRQER